jgi:hypothetical protein
MSALGQNATLPFVSESVYPPVSDIGRCWSHGRFGPIAAHASQQRASLFDNIIGALLEEQRHVEAERLRGLEIDRQLELDRGLDG